MGLKTNKGNTGHMRLFASCRRVQNIAIGDYGFEGVNEFVYLGSPLNNTNNTLKEIKRRVMAGHRAYFANIKFHKSALLSKSTKMKLYKTGIRPVVCYGTEIRTLSNYNVNRLEVSKRTEIRKMYGAVNEEGIW